jgi:hypothetical protein
MKNRIFILTAFVLVLSVFPLQISKGQDASFGASDAITAANTGTMISQLTTLVTTIETMKKSAALMQSALEVVDVYNNLKDIVRLVELIEATICGMEEYQLYLEISIRHNSCIATFDYDLINAKLAFTTNIINIASKAASLFSSADRVNSVKDAITALEGTMKKIEEHNKIVHSQIEADVMTAYNQHLVKSLYEIKM